MRPSGPPHRSATSLKLGHPWTVFHGVPLYQPWLFFVWWFEFDAYAPAVFQRGAYVAASGGFLGALSAMAGSVWRARQAKLVTTYGSARWASPRDLKRSGMLRPAGVFLGRAHDQYLRHDGPEHVMAFAPTRSGKGVGLVVPTLLSWTGSAVIHDIKGENFTITAGWRSRFSHCLYLNPTDPRSAAYNPLLEVRRGTHEVRDVPEHRRRAGRPRRCAGAALALGEDQPLAAGRHDPPRPLRRPGQDPSAASPTSSPIRRTRSNTRSS